MNIRARASRLHLMAALTALTALTAAAPVALAGDRGPWA